MSIFDARWQSLIEKNEKASFFHLPAWSTLLADCYGYKAFVLAIEGKNGKLVAGMPLMEVSSWLTGKRWVSLPFTDYCQPLYNDRDTLSHLLLALAGLRRNESIARIEVKWHLPEISDVYSNTNFVRHTLDISRGVEVVFNNIKKMHRRNIEKSKQLGLTISYVTSKKAIDDFYLLHVETRRQHGTPVQPKRFFNLIWEKLIDKDLGFLLMAYHEELPIAGAVFLKYGDVIIYKYGASSKQGRESRANNLIFWTAIQWGCANGFRLFDWGRTDISNEGLRSFKSGWGAEETLVTYSVLSDKPVNSSNAKSLEKYMAQVIKRSPKYAGRVIGEIFYKHFG